jgi:Domain of unknown function (DUF4406)
MARVYLFGPMRGCPDWNFPAFIRAAAQLRELGHEVFSPAERDLADGFDGRGSGTDAELAGKGFDLRTAMAADLTWIATSAEILVGLPGWQQSSGALAEVCLAWALHIPVHELDRVRLGDLTRPLLPQGLGLEGVR